VLDFLAETLLPVGGFVQTTDGRCRLHPQLARVVAARCRVPQDKRNEHAKWVAALVIA
jgi:hypothetical protein